MLSVIILAAFLVACMILLAIFGAGIGALLVFLDLPGSIARDRNHNSKNAIQLIGVLSFLSFFLSIVAGSFYVSCLFFMLWIAAIVWASSATPPGKASQEPLQCCSLQPGELPRVCSFCDMYISPRARVCPFCQREMPSLRSATNILPSHPSRWFIYGTCKDGTKRSATLTAIDKAAARQKADAHFSNIEIIREDSSD